jgi:uncharacterized repeat protein (TIGR03803 family)
MVRTVRPNYLIHGSRFWIQLGTSIFLCIVVLLFATSFAKAQSLTPLYEFHGGADGESPNGVISDAAGNIYGTTIAGGQTIFGTVFKLSPSGIKTILYNFTGGTDGREPHGMLVRDAQGNLYGTTEYGGDLNVLCAGVQGCGVVFKISPTGHETVLHRFTGKADGGQPVAGLTADGSGNLYGTTAGGGNSSCAYFAVGCGVVFKIDSAHKLTVLYSFAGGSDGGNPEPRLILDSSGNIYGSTTGVGAGDQGTIFKLDPSGHEKILLTFAGTNGSQPYGSLALDGKGNLYGTTYGGGNLNDCNAGFGCGIVFELKPDGQEPILNVFTGGASGWGPVAGLLRDKKGNLYGTAALGGAGTDCCGVVFKVTPNGVETVLHTFTGGADGSSPETDLTQDRSGNLYGGALGGTYGYGVIFKITP